MVTSATPPLGESPLTNHCEVCGAPVARAGEFDTYECWLHWHSVMMVRGIDIVEVTDYIELYEQPWYEKEMEVEHG